jgi:hypothetical protein
VLQYLERAESRCVCGVRTDCDLCVSGFSDELWRLSLKTLEWTRIEVTADRARPSARYSHVMSSVGLDLWVHGGETSSGEGDTC